MLLRHPSGEVAPLLSSPTPSLLDSPNDACHTRSYSSSKSRIAAAMYSFAVLGLFTSSIGVIISPISQDYNLSHLHVSLVFIAGPIGYILAAQCNSFIHSRFGQFGVAVLGPTCHIIAAGAISTNYSFNVILVALAFAAVGNGILDGSWCAWAGNMANANTVSGMLHGSFSVGAALGPVLANAMSYSGGRQWYEWFYVLAAASLISLIVLSSAFWHENAARYRRGHCTGIVNRSNNSKAILRYRATWLSSAYFLAYVGTETAISGWVIFFLDHARHATPYEAHLSSSGFWAGMAIGRFVLGALADRLGVIHATTVYLLCAITVEIIFAFVRLPAASIALMAFLGSVMGPLFPSGIVVITKLLPRELHIAAVSFVASIGQVGAAVFPFAIGAIIQGAGIGVFRFAIIAFTVLTLLLWMSFSRLHPTIAVSLSEEHDED